MRGVLHDANRAIRPRRNGAEGVSEPQFKGHLVPEIERIHQKAVELERAHIATLNDGESFCVKFVMVKGALRIILEPKRIEIS